MDFKFNYQAAIQQLKDMAYIDVIKSLAPDEQTRTFIEKSMLVFVKYGIPADKAFSIIVDLSNVLNEENKEDE